MKKWVIILAGVIIAFTLTACSSAKLGTNKKQDDKVIAKNDAQTVLDFMYKGNISGFSDISDDSASDVKNDVIEKLEEKQTDALIANGNIDDYALKVDGSVYTADTISLKNMLRLIMNKLLPLGKRLSNL